MLAATHDVRPYLVLWVLAGVALGGMVWLELRRIFTRRGR